MAITQEINPKIGEGIYLAYDVAEILNLKYSKVRSLMTGYWQSYTFGSDGSRAINFVSLIEFYIYYYLREQNHSPTAIKRIHEKLSNVLKIKHPFASLKLLSFDKENEGQKGELWLEFNGFIMKADGKLQPAFEQFIQPYLKQIEFGENSIAKKYYPIFNLNSSKNIVVDPMHQFGLPVLNGTNIQTATIYNLINAGESRKKISFQYEISEDVIEDVLVYYKKRA